MANRKPSGEEVPKHGFSAFRPCAQTAMETMSEHLLEQLGLTLNLSVQHFRGEPYRRPNIRYFNGGLINHLVTKDCVATLSSIALGTTDIKPGLLEQRSIKIASIEQRQHEHSGSFYLCGVPDTHSMKQLNDERRLLLDATAAAFNRSAKGFRTPEEFVITFARIGTKTKPAEIGHISMAQSIITEHCPEKIPLEPPFFQTRTNEVFALADLVQHATDADIEPVGLYP